MYGGWVHYLALRLFEQDPAQINQTLSLTTQTQGGRWSAAPCLLRRGKEPSWAPSLTSSVLLGSATTSPRSPRNRHPASRIRYSATDAPNRGRSLDHLVGARQEGLRDRQAERLGGLQIDHQLEFGGLFDRQIGRLGALEDLSGVSAD